MEHLPTIYGAAVLLPLASFFIILLFAQQLGRFAAWVATSAILVAGAFSFWALAIWLTSHFPPPVHHGGQEEHEVGGQKSEVRRYKAADRFLVAMVQEPAGHAP